MGLQNKKRRCRSNLLFYTCCVLNVFRVLNGDSISFNSYFAFYESITFSSSNFFDFTGNFFDGSFLSCFSFLFCIVASYERKTCDNSKR